MLKDMKFKRAKDSIEDKATKKALREGAKMIQREVKANSPVDSRALKTSIANKVKKSKKGQGIYGVVGPKSKYTKVVNGLVRRPSKYALLVEKGTKRMKGKKYLQRSWSGKKEQYIETVRKIIQEELNKDLAK